MIKAEKGESDDEVPEDPPPFHYDVGYVLSTWLTYHRYGRYPEAGSFNDQCPYLIEDFVSMTLWYIRVEKGVTSLVFMPQNAENWQAMMGD